MKKFIFTILFMVLCTAALLVSCDTGGGSGFFPLPPCMYIAGDNYNRGIQRACYWTGSKRIDLDGYITGSIAVSDGKVLVTGDFLTPFTDDDLFYWEINGSKYGNHACYWVDGKRQETGEETIIINNGKVFFVNWNDYRVDNFFPSRFDVSGGKVYAAGTYYNHPDIYVSYFVDGIRHDIIQSDTLNHYSAITVSENGKVYIAGISYRGIIGEILDGNLEGGKFWYYADGEFFEYPISKWISINRITLSGGKVYVFGFSPDENYYFVDGEKITVNLPEGSHVNDYAIANGVIYMAGYYESGDKPRACWWAGGERHDLDGSRATAIWVGE